MLNKIYQKLYHFYGPQGWWPGKTRFEVIVGAILTQNTAWRNVEVAIKNLKRAHILTPKKINDIDRKKLAQLIRPSGYHNVKSRRLKNFTNFLFKKYSGSLKKISRRETGLLRKKLLDLNGIGPETCDSILLYAFNRPVFVVDAYTKRIFSRHKLVRPNATYDEIQEYCIKNLPKNKKVYNEFHALIVRLAKEACKSNPQCRGCPLEKNAKIKILQNSL